LRRLSTKNAVTICDYIAALHIEVNPSNYYRRDCIKFPYLLARFLGDKPFSNMNREDVKLDAQ
jgi:hypothetical protein